MMREERQEHRTFHGNTLLREGRIDSPGKAERPTTIAAGSLSKTTGDDSPATSRYEGCPYE